MKVKIIMLVIGSLIGLSILACSIGPTTPAAAPTAFVGGDCESPAQRIDMNTNLSESVNAGTYPDSCKFYCLWVPNSGKSLDIGISNFDIDLDLYVDTDISVLAFEDHGQWTSNDYGTGDESVSISNASGRYYIQVCSYEGLASPFTLTNTFKP
jgi:hypothetical protein